ncbi:hypothetical protein Nepgr_022202 [Nepenthes gracilis]|uniref:DELLA protein n=1 Tax=Nepenthes gracilis TaxID=150966 RepID=A0AAD3T259_NEPGR|nr:hypothetical protein Nepgr_022202 [Nepenthes gracilis]
MLYLLLKADRKTMKREHQETANHPLTGGGGGGGGEGCSSRSKTWKEDQGDGGMDELLEGLGYKVKSSDMADVAQKLEQLEMAIGTFQEGQISHLFCETVHYNPSDIYGWVDSMLSELNPSQTFDPNGSFYPIRNSILGQQPSMNSSARNSLIYDDNSEYDLSVIPGFALKMPSEWTFDLQREGTSKRMKHDAPQISTSPVNSAAKLRSLPEATRPLLMVDSEEAGVRLVHILMACAEAVQNEDLKLADALVMQIRLLAVSQAGAMRKVAIYFAEAIARRIHKIYPQQSSIDSFYSDTLQMHFYETCPYLQFAHFTANHAILEAFSDAPRVHVIDFSMSLGMQWPALMQALALRPGGPPAFRLTGIGPPQPDNTDALEQVGWKLAQLAGTIGVEFHYRGFVCDSLADLEPSMLDIRPSAMETLAVNSICELHRLLARQGAIDKVLSNLKVMKPKIVTIVEQEAKHNGPVFLDRFNEALHYYSTLFDSLDGCWLTQSNSQDLAMSEVYLGRQICNVVACEGPERVERHETLAQWRERMESSGFDPVHLGSNAFKQASMLLDIFSGGDGYRVEENNGCLMLGWHSRPLIATSAWRIASR